MNKLSQAYLAKAEVKRSTDMRKEADMTFSGLMESGKYTRSEDEELKWDFLACLSLDKKSLSYSCSKGGKIRAGKVASKALRTLTRRASWCAPANAAIPNGLTFR